MWLFKTIVIFFFLFVVGFWQAGRAADAESLSEMPKAKIGQVNKGASKKPDFKKEQIEGEFSYRTFTLNYLSWSESVKLSVASLEEKTLSVFNALNLGMETENFHGNWGKRYGLSLMVGQASAGNSLTQLNYVATYQSFYGAGTFFHWSYRNSDRSLVSFGPIAVYRNVSFPQASLTVKSGSNFNLGYTVDLKLRFFTHWELIPSMGSLLYEASTLWGVGFGYKL